MSLHSKITRKITDELGLNKDSSEVIEYGASAFIQIISSTLIVLISGLLLGVKWQSITVLFISSILRQYSGGAHASRPSICLIVGTLSSVGFALLSNFIVNRIDINFYITEIFVLVSIMLSYIVIYKKAPVDNINKPIDNEKKRKKMKRYSIFILSFYVLILIILAIGFKITGNINYIDYSLCIIFAILWQVFNLTIIGHNLLGKLDSFLNWILFSKGGKL